MLELASASLENCFAVTLRNIPYGLGIEVQSWCKDRNWVLVLAARECPFPVSIGLPLWKVSRRLALASCSPNHLSLLGATVTILRVPQNRDRMRLSATTCFVRPSCSHCGRRSFFVLTRGGRDCYWCMLLVLQVPLPVGVETQSALPVPIFSQAVWSPDVVLHDSVQSNASLLV